ncbi:hypothetical protein WDU94_007709 [Cyamophila willieti]
MKTTGKKSVQTTLVQGKLEIPVAHKAESRTGSRRFLQTLQHSSVDKENLVGGGNKMKDVNTENEKQTKVITPSTKNKGDKASHQTASLKDDLTNDVPSEHYWKLLAEKRRVALEESLKENETLHNKVKLLEEENSVVKDMLKEATELVQTLTEIVQENVDENDLDFSLNISK